MDNLLALCVCGHTKDLHETLRRPYCAMLYRKRKFMLSLRCDCKEFKLDNLKYLEALAFRNGY